MLKAAICSQCGSPIKLDSSGKEGVCLSCGTPYYAEKINKTENTFITQNIVKNISGKLVADSTDYIENAKMFYKLGEIDMAEKAFRKSIDSNPSNYEGWWGLARILSSGFTDIKIWENAEFLKYVEKARLVANEEETQIIMQEYEPFFNAVNHHYRIVQEIRETKGKFSHLTTTAIDIVLPICPFCDKKTVWEYGTGEPHELVYRCKKCLSIVNCIFVWEKETFLWKLIHSKKLQRIKVIRAPYYNKHNLEIGHEYLIEELKKITKI